MTGRERFLAVLHGRKPDRTPVGHISALTTAELQQTTGCFMPEVHLDAEKLVRLCAANHEVLGFDAVTFIINYFGEPAAAGVEMNWGSPSEYPIFASHPWREPEDAAVPGDLLDRPPVKTYLDALKLARRDYGDRLAVLGKVMGPFSMVQAMHGVEQTMLDVMDAPDEVRSFLRVAADVLVRCANAQFAVGIDAISIGEGGAGANMLSPQMYDDLLRETHRRMLRRIDGPTILHMCGDITPRLDSLKQIPLDFFHFDWAIKPKAMKAAAEGKFKLVGNVNTKDLLMAGPDEIARQVVENLEAGVEMIAPGCAVSPNCPNANFIAMTDAVRKWHGG